MRTWKLGAIGKLDTPNGVVAYTKCLKFPLLQFYDGYDSSNGELRNHLFDVWVHKSVLKFIDRIQVKALNSEEVRSRSFFKIDPISNKLTIYSEGVERIGTIEEAKNLECAAVWDIEHIEERVQSERAGKVSEFKKSLGRGIFG